MANGGISAEPRVSVAQQLDKYLASAPPFSWRAHHCGDFAARWVLARTGKDPLAGLHVSGLNNAAAVCRRYDGLSDAVASLTGAREIPHLSAQIGDIVMMQTDSAIGGALGICAGREVAYTSPGGIAWASIMLGCKAWRIEP